MAYRVLLEKENFKFSGSHFTIFSPGQAERLHGHNYYVCVEVRLKSVNQDLGMGFDFNAVKPLVRALTEGLDEFVLLPANSKFLKVSTEADSVKAEFGKKLYVFPKEDVKILPLSNITSEELARYIAEQLVSGMRTGDFSGVTGISLSVQETRGQSVWYDLEL